MGKQDSDIGGRLLEKWIPINVLCSLTCQKCENNVFSQDASKDLMSDTVEKWNIMCMMNGPGEHQVSDPNMIQKLRFYNKSRLGSDINPTDPVLNEDEMNALIR